MREETVWHQPEAATQSNTEFPPGNSTTQFTAKSALASLLGSLPRRYARECRAFLASGSEHTMTVSARAIIAYIISDEWA